MRYDFYAYMDRMKYIKRWQLMRSVREENIMEHSQSVAMLAHALAVIKNERFGGKVDVLKTVLYALYHETSEVLTGDLPTPIKYYNPEINAAYKGIEAVACDKMLSMLPPELRTAYEPIVREDGSELERKLVKAADKLDALIKCIEEVKCGNKEFVKAKKSIRAALDAYGLKEVDYFIKKLLPAFERTLDEME